MIAIYIYIIFNNKGIIPVDNVSARGAAEVSNDQKVLSLLAI